MEEKINILLILKKDNCLTDAMDFLLNSRRSLNEQYVTYVGTLRTPPTTVVVNSGPRLNEQYVKEYAYIGGPPTIIEEPGPNTLRVYIVVKSLDTIKSDIDNITQSMYHYDAVVMFMSDESDTELILDFMRSLNFLNLPRPHGVTIIEKESQAGKTNIKNLGKVKSVDLSGYTLTDWRYKEMVANHWSTYLFNNQCCVWYNITKGKIGPTRISYNSEIMFRSIISVFDFFYRLIIITHSNIDVIAGGTKSSGTYLLTLTYKGNSYRQKREQAKELLTLLNVKDLSDFSKLLNTEMEQLACHLSHLAILCDEIVNFTSDLHRQLFHNFSGLELFENMYYNKLQGVNRKNITEVVLDSLDTMSKMKYTGKYIKNVLGIRKLDLLRGFLRRPYSIKNVLIDSSNIPTTTASQHEDNIQNIHIENRIGNIDLLKSLQKTLQEFMEELKDMRQLQGQYSKVITKEKEREIKEKLDNLEKDNRNLKENFISLKQDIGELKEKLSELEQKLDEASNTMMIHLQRTSTK